MSKPPLTVACIGLGKMGAGIAHRIQGTGFKLVVYNRSRHKEQPFIRAGATAAGTPREAAAQADVVLTSLMDDQSVLDTVQGHDGILAGLRTGAAHIGASTISSRASVYLAKLHQQHGSFYLAAPVLGRPDLAAAGKLRTFVAGDPQAIERARPVFEAYTSEQLVLGPDPAAATSMKLVANFMIASMIELLGEAFVFGEKRGLPSDKVQALINSMLPSPALQEYAEHIRTRSFDPAGFELSAGYKDIQLILEAAGEVRTPLPYADVIRARMLTALADEMGKRDWSALTETMRLNAGLK